MLPFAIFSLYNSSSHTLLLLLFPYISSRSPSQNFLTAQMRSKLVIHVAFFSATAFAQTSAFNIDTAEVTFLFRPRLLLSLTSTVQETKVFNEVEGYVTILEANPTFRADIAALITALPSSVVQKAEQDPEALIDQIGANGKLPAWVSAIPTPVIESLETLVAKPIKAVGDIEGYVAQIVEEPEFVSAIFVPMTAIPTSVQQAFESNPAGFLENIVTATPLPPWVTGIPAPLQSDIGSIVNEALSIIENDLQSNISTTRVSIGLTPSSGYATVTATGTGGVVGYNGTNAGPTATLTAYMGAAAPMKTAAAGMTALMVGLWWVLHIFNNNVVV